MTLATTTYVMLALACGLWGATLYAIGRDASDWIGVWLDQRREQRILDELWEDE